MYNKGDWSGLIMAYKALYRTYRPQSFEDLAGQDHVKKTLQNAIKEGKIAHAYLFAGPRGTGKTTVAKIFAKAINCNGDHVPCNQCDSCKAITAGEHPDVIEIDAASNNGVDEVRDLIDKVKYAPISAKYKVYIIDEVHMMSPGAFNALLKTLEEPPAHIVFILATTEPHKILPTIISRCQRFDFKRVEDQDIEQRLTYVLQSENKHFEPEALEIIAQLADGGMRDALSILEQCLAFNDDLTVANINQVYGLLSIQDKIKFIKLLLNKDMKAVLESLDTMMSASIDMKRLTFDLIDILKDIIIYKNTQSVDVLFVLRQSHLDSIIPYILVDEAFDMIQIFIEASEHYNQSTNAHTYFELAVLKICNHIKEDHKIQNEEVIQPINTQNKPVIDDQEVINTQPEESALHNHSYEKLDIEEVMSESVQPVQVQETIKQPVVEEIIEDNIEELQEDNHEENIDHIEVSFDDILNILVQAKRTVLNDIQDRWQVISKYRYNLNTAKFATMLCDGKPVAAGENAFILTFKHLPDVNNVNYSDNYHLLKQFLKEVLGQEFDFIAVLEDDWPQMRNKFIELNRSGQLPKPQVIVLHHIKEYQEPKPQLTDAQKLAIEMFGKDIVEIEE